MPYRNLRGRTIAHLIGSAIDQRAIFERPQHKGLIVRLIRDASIKYGVDVFAFAIVDTHYHLIVHAHARNTSRMMRSANHRFSLIYNRDRRRRGPLFAGPFRSFPIHTLEYALDRSFYVHLNPVKERLAVRPERYRWSSAAAYVGAASAPAWIKVTSLWSLLSRQRDQAQSKYAAAMTQFAKDANGASPAIDEFPAAE